MRQLTETALPGMATNRRLGPAPFAAGTSRFTKIGGTRGSLRLFPPTRSGLGRGGMTVGLLAVNTHPEFPHQMVHMPPDGGASREFPCNACKMQQTAVCLVHSCLPIHCFVSQRRTDWIREAATLAHRAPDYPNGKTLYYTAFIVLHE